MKAASEKLRQSIIAKLGSDKVALDVAEDIAQDVLLGLLENDSQLDGLADLVQVCKIENIQLYVCQPDVTSMDYHHRNGEWFTKGFVESIADDVDVISSPLIIEVD